MPWWHRAIVVGVVIVATALAAKLADASLVRRLRAPQAVTRYRVLRRSLITGIVTIGFLSALLTIPQVRAVAGGLLASSAIVGIIVGFASQRTLGNFIAGLLIAFSQPLRLGDLVEVDGQSGRVEEIGLSYTFIRREDGARVVIPNEKLASDTIVNSSIVSREKVAEITVQIPLASDLSAVVDSLREEVAEDHDGEVFVSSLDTAAAVVTVRAHAADEAQAAQIARDLRLRVHARLRAGGVFA